ncbi:MAG: phenylalanine--tRNA ligase subunit beta [Armatimonadota bacterium]
MKVSINWLKDYVDINQSLDTLADGLTMAGLEVEQIDHLSENDFINAGGEGKSADTVFDVSITPNRGDALSMIGIAREAAALNGTSVKSPNPEITFSNEKASDFIDISIKDPDLCKRYVGIIIRGVEIKESPGWLKDRIIAAGMRPINNVVDITNYVMVELGQPLHAFDYTLLKGGKIIVRRAVDGEKIKLIDEVERKLDSNMLVIADEEKPVALAGVMGGFESEINNNTKDILIESANFDCVCIRRTSKKINLTTESSYRFERGVDPSITALAAKRCVELIKQLGGGEVADGVIDVYPSVISPLVIDLRPQRVVEVLGVDIREDQIIKILNSYGISAEKNDNILKCTVPTVRTDITREIDLIEEVIRGYGYDKMDTTLPKKSMQGHDSKEGILTEKIRNILMACGGQEVLTHSIISSKLVKIADENTEYLKIRNPLSEDLDAVRASLLPNLLEVVSRNQSHGLNDLNIFESGKVYYNFNNDCDEKLAVAGLIVGSIWGNAWAIPTKLIQSDFYNAKGIVENLLSRLGIENVVFEAVSDITIMHPTRTAKIIINGLDAGFVGEIHPDVIKEMDVRGKPCGYELDFDILMKSLPKKKKFAELPKFPSSYRHLSLVISENVRYSDLEKVCMESCSELLSEVGLLDEYKGEPIERGKKNLTISLIFRSNEKTLTDEEVNSAVEKIRNGLKKSLEVTFR